MKKLFTAICLVCLGTMGAFAQQDAQYSLYMFNGLYINPAYAGSHEVADIMGIYRHEYVGIDGAPHSGNVSFHSPFKRNQYAMGATMFMEHVGLYYNLNGTIPFAYRIRVGKVKIALGIQAGFNYYAKDYTSAIPDQAKNAGVFDPIFSTNSVRGTFAPNFGAGIYIYSKRFYVGFSVPHILPISISDTKGGLSTDTTFAHQYNMYILTAGVMIGKQKAAVKFKPSFLMKYSKGLKNNIPDFDINLSLLFIDRIWLGATYRLGTGYDNTKGTAVIGMLEGKITPNLRIGYAFEWSLTSLNQFATGGTHDIMLGYEFGVGGKRLVSPRYVNYF